MRRPCLFLLISFLLATPCANAADAPGVVFLVPGVGGIDFITPLNAQITLPRAGVPHEIRVFEWTYGTGRLLRDLQDTRRLMAKADELAEAVRQVKANDPSRPVYLVGHSGGGGLVLAAAERLPPGTLERIVLLSAAVSPGYDLRPALRATRREIVSFNSAADSFFLGWGTTTFGTTDRVYGPAAGRYGFQIPDDLDEDGRQLYQRLVQLPWRWDMIFDFRGGLHNSTIAPHFLARHVAPWLKP
jgi:pimeloyl-ACP methyl ester carboxylesterase